MKIDESCINHNVVRLINDMILEPCEYAEEPHMVLAVLNQVKGVLELAKELKEVLKV